MMAGSINNINRLVPGLVEANKVKPQGKEIAPATNEGSFTDLLKNVINDVNETHQDAGQIQQAFLNGDPVELHEVMIKAEEAGLATDLLLEIRNKLVSAYQEIMRMPM